MFKSEYVAVVLLGVAGLAPWLLTSAVFAELPLLVSETPERNGFAAWAVLLTQVGNVANVLVALLFAHRPHWSARRVQRVRCAANRCESQWPPTGALSRATRSVRGC